MPRSFSEGFLRPIPDKKAGGNIKSIQRGVSSLGMDITETNITINNVDLGKAIVHIDVSTSNTLARPALIRGELINSNTLRIIRGGGNDISTAMWQVVEFENVKNLQKGTRTFDVSTSFVTISLVVLSKSIIIASFSSLSDSSNGHHPSARLGNSTEVYLSRASGSTTGHWQVIEFN